MCIRLTDYLDLPTLQAMQDNLARLAGVQAHFENADGSLVTAPSPEAVLVGPSPRDTGSSPDRQVFPIVVGAQAVARFVVSADALIASEAIDLAAAISETLGRLCSEAHQLRRRVSELSALYDTSSLLAGAYDLQRVLDCTAERVCTVLKVDACSIRLLSDDRRELVIRAVHNLSQAYVNKGPVLVARNPIDAQALAGESVYIPNVPGDRRTRYPSQARDEGLVSGLIVGMMHGGRAVGVIRAYMRSRHRFGPSEVSLLRALATQAAAAIASVRDHEAAREADRWDRQIRYAGDIQRRMIPSQPPTHSGVEFGCAYDPTFEVGGDFYDFVTFPWGHLGVAIADVVGKGVPAALMMASLRSALRVYAHTVYDLEEIIGHVNRHFHRDTRVSEFATAFYAVVAPDGRSMTYCNAGHCAPLLLRNGAVRPLATGGMVLGVRRDAVFEKEVLALQSGDVLLLYTDGVIEAADFSGEMYGEGRLIESLLRKAHLSADLIARDVLWDVRRFVGLAAQSDDLTLVAMKVR